MGEGGGLVVLCASGGWDRWVDGGEGGRVRRTGPRDLRASPRMTAADGDRDATWDGPAARERGPARTAVPLLGRGMLWAAVQGRAATTASGMWPSRVDGSESEGVDPSMGRRVRGQLAGEAEGGCEGGGGRGGWRDARDGRGRGGGGGGQWGGDSGAAKQARRGSGRAEAAACSGTGEGGEWGVWEGQSRGGGGGGRGKEGGAGSGGPEREGGGGGEGADHSGSGRVGGGEGAEVGGGTGGGRGHGERVGAGGIGGRGSEVVGSRGQAQAREEKG